MSDKFWSKLGADVSKTILEAASPDLLISTWLNPTRLSSNNQNPQGTPANSTIIDESEESMNHRDPSEAYFDWLLMKARAENPNVKAVPAGALCQTLWKLGMAREVQEEKLVIMLNLSGYADKNGYLNLEQFTLFAEDVRLFDGVALRNFFRILETDEGRVLTQSDFKDAFHALGLEITDLGADSLERYVFLPSDFDVNQTFEQFLQISLRLYEIKAGITSFSNTSLSKDERLQRMLAFASSYTRKITVIEPVLDVSPRTQHGGSGLQGNLWDW